jgi:hypothetical protein
MSEPTRDDHHARPQAADEQEKTHGDALAEAVETDAPEDDQ